MRTETGGLHGSPFLSRNRPSYLEVVGEDFLLTLREVSRTAKGEVIYDCPWCEERYGPNPERFYPKLYYSPAKGVGFCFRCGTALRVETNPSSLSSLSSRDRVLPSLVQAQEALAPIEDLSLLLPLEREKGLATAYLLHRSPYLREILPRFPVEYYLASFGGGEYGVVFPFRYRGKVVSYQIRHFRTDCREPHERYTTRMGPKIPYSPFGLDDREPVESISLVEGIFGTFGLLYLSQNLAPFRALLAPYGLTSEGMRRALSYPIATLGYHLSGTVLDHIKSLAPLHVVVAMDQRELSLKAVEVISEEVSSVERIDVLDLGDPDEFASSLYQTLHKGQNYSADF